MQLRQQKLTAREVIDRLTIDDKTSESYYKQLTRQIKNFITMGEIGHGLGLPSERDLAEALNLSRTTIKRCYDELRQAGLLTANGRGGTSVNNPSEKRELLGRLKSFNEEMQALGMIPSMTLEACEVVFDRMISSIFHQPSNASFLRVVRIRLADGIPMAREIAWYDLSVAPKLAEWDTTGSIYAFLQNVCQIKLSQVEQSIEAIPSSDLEASTFNFTANHPCLLFKRRTYSLESKLIEYIESTFRGDVYAHRVKLDI